MIIEALFDGKVFHPIKPFILEPDTRVRISIEIETFAEKTKSSFLQTARSLSLDGPPDWSLNLENYLYVDKTDED